MMVKLGKEETCSTSTAAHWGGLSTCWPCSCCGAAWAQTPTTTTISEGLFGSRSGVEKKDAAMSFLTAALQLSDAVTSRHIVDPDKFKQGLSAVIDGTVLA